MHIDRVQTEDRTLNDGHNKEEVEEQKKKYTIIQRKKRKTRTVRTNKGILRKKYCVVAFAVDKFRLQETLL